MLAAWSGVLVLDIVTSHEIRRWAKPQRLRAVGTIRRSRELLHGGEGNPWYAASGFYTANSLLRDTARTIATLAWRWDDSQILKRKRRGKEHRTHTCPINWHFQPKKKRKQSGCPVYRAIIESSSMRPLETNCSTDAGGQVGIWSPSMHNRRTWSKRVICSFPSSWTWWRNLDTPKLNEVSTETQVVEWTRKWCLYSIATAVIVTLVFVAM